jgi:hypothetical protein
VLVGNKADMTAERAVDPEQGAALAKEFGMQFFETSAKTGLNVQEVFIFLAQKVKSRKEAEENEKMKVSGVASGNQAN